jgi:hypothetical protein
MSSFTFGFTGDGGARGSSIGSSVTSSATSIGGGSKSATATLVATGAGVSAVPRPIQTPIISMIPESAASTPAPIQIAFFGIVSAIVSLRGLATPARRPAGRACTASDLIAWF